MKGLREIISDNESAAERAMGRLGLASTKYPAVVLRTGQRLHVCRCDGRWVVWLNTEVTDFDGLCIAVRGSRQAAVTDAVEVLEAALEELQKPAR